MPLILPSVFNLNYLRIINVFGVEQHKPSSCNEAHQTEEQFPYAWLLNECSPNNNITKNNGCSWQYLPRFHAPFNYGLLISSLPVRPPGPPGVPPPKAPLPAVLPEALPAPPAGREVAPLLLPPPPVTEPLEPTEYPLEGPVDESTPGGLPPARCEGVPGEFAPEDRLSKSDIWGPDPTLPREDDEDESKGFGPTDAEEPPGGAAAWLPTDEEDELLPGAGPGLLPNDEDEFPGGGFPWLLPLGKNPVLSEEDTLGAEELSPGTGKPGLYGAPPANPPRIWGTGTGQARRPEGRPRPWNIK